MAAALAAAKLAFTTAENTLAAVDPSLFCFCNGAFTHSAGRNDCPLSISRSNAVRTNGAPACTNISGLPISVQSDVHTSDLIVMRSAQDRTYAMVDLDTATTQEIMAAVIAKKVEATDVYLEIAKRSADNPSASDERTLTLMLTSLKGLVDNGLTRQISDIKGGLLHVFALALKSCATMKDPKIVTDVKSIQEIVQKRLDMNASGARTSAKISIIRAQTSEVFLAAVYKWSMICHSMGVMTFDIQFLWVWEVVYIPLLRDRRPFTWVQEFFIICLDNLDSKACTFTEVAAFQQSVMHANASHWDNVLSNQSGPSSSNSPSSSSTSIITDLSQITVGSKNPTAIICAAFNGPSNVHKKANVDRAGHCIFRHVCNQFVDDKGPAGVCGGAHSRQVCTYDKAHHRATALP